MRADETTKLHTIPGGDAALTAIDTAAERLAELQVRAKAAEQGAEDARHGRRQLVHRAAIGEVISPSVVAKADKSVADAEGAAALAGEALQAGRVAVAEAEAEGRALIEAEWSRRLCEARERRVRAAEELDRLGKAFGAAVVEFAEAGAALGPMLLPNERLDQQRTSLRDRRAAYLTLPAAIQNGIVQMGRAAVTGAVLGPRERSIWL
jgi:hypothetical protein